MSNEAVSKKLLDVINKQKPPPIKSLLESLSLEDDDEKSDDAILITIENEEIDLSALANRKTFKLGQPKQLDGNRVSFIEKVELWEADFERKLEILESGSIELESPGPEPIAPALLYQSMSQLESLDLLDKLSESSELKTKPKGKTMDLLCTPLRKSTRISQNFYTTRISLRRDKELIYKSGKVNEDYYLFELIGEGTFGKVRRGVCKMSTLNVAIKRIARRKLDKLSQMFLENEIRILRAVKHENIIALYDLYGSAKYVSMVMELCSGGDVFDWLESEDHIEEVMVAIVLKQIIAGVSYLHSSGVVHRDLKLENLLLSTPVVGLLKKPIIKIADFGFATTIKDPNELIEGTCGSLNYIAPEVLTDRNYTKQCDLWSIGVIVYAMLGGYLPFCGSYSENSRQQTYGRIQRGEFSFNDPVWEDVSGKAKGLVRGLLTVNPEKRLKCRSVLSHEWVDHCNKIELSRAFMDSE